MISLTIGLGEGNRRAELGGGLRQDGTGSGHHCRILSFLLGQVARDGGAPVCTSKIADAVLRRAIVRPVPLLGKGDNCLLPRCLLWLPCCPKDSAVGVLLPLLLLGHRIRYHRIRLSFSCSSPNVLCAFIYLIIE